MACGYIMALMHEFPRVIVWGEEPGTLYRLERPVRICEARCYRDVPDVLRDAAEAASHGLVACGFVTYEAAPAFDAALATHSARRLPLAWFGIFEKRTPAELLTNWKSDDFILGAWNPSVSQDRHQEAVERIRHYLRAGDTYQVNFTFRLRAEFRGDPLGLFLRLFRNQRAAYCAMIDTESFAICCASPELFFGLDGSHLVSKPMKGTAPRGLSWEEDVDLVRRLRKSEKDRAENVMIVDMVRNDMGRIAEPGTVRVERLFDVERYPTVLQMTSTVACETRASLPEIMRALFPCASITGAPKVRTMAIIREIEDSPRGVYTGTIGVCTGARRAEFNVAIRTVTIFKHENVAEYGVGGGIVWDSTAEHEYEECLTKARVLNTDIPDFELLESLLWEGGKGYFLLDAHLQRLSRSAEYFGYRIDPDKIRTHLLEAGRQLASGRFKVRLTVSREGIPKITIQQLPDTDGVWRVAMAKEPVVSHNPFLYHKTTHRDTYERARRGRHGYDDVLLYNERGEVTESTVANVVVELGGRRLTPPVSCGLLSGVFREWLLSRGEIEERVISSDVVRRADRIFLINSVRRWIPVVLCAE
ncbi:MAG: aminodeoxychorismate synthase component I [Kiritimatiellae bacterium]|nr:aminodeoxychorismate synthase component I [Kiritimatiellia bacterium]